MLKEAVKKLATRIAPIIFFYKKKQQKIANILRPLSKQNFKGHTDFE